MRGDFNLVAGDILNILVGQRGGTASLYSASGGGGTFVLTKPPTIHSWSLEAVEQDETLTTQRTKQIPML